MYLDCEFLVENRHQLNYSCLLKFTHVSFMSFFDTPDRVLGSLCSSVFLVLLFLCGGFRRLVFIPPSIFFLVLSLLGSVVVTSTVSWVTYIVK